MLRSDGMIASISPNSDSTTSVAGRSEIDRPSAPAAGEEQFEQLAHQLEHRRQLGILLHRLRVTFREDRVHGGIGHARIAVDDAFVHLVPHDISATVDLHQARLHETIDMRIEAAQAGRELRWEHVDRALGKVDGRAALVGFFVEGTPLGHVMGDVGDVHPQPVMPVSQAFNRDCVIKVACVLAVDGHGGDRTKISSPAKVAFLDDTAEAPRLLNRLFRMRIWNVVLANDDLRVDAWLLDTSEHFDDAADWPARRRRPACDFDEHHVTGLGRGPLARGEVDVGQDTAIERDDVAEV